MSVNIAVVPVAGLGTRLLPATKSQPKEMLPVGRKPVVQYVFEELTAAGMQRILFVTGPGKASIENHFDINEELVQMLREKGREELLQLVDELLHLARIVGIGRVAAGQSEAEWDVSWHQSTVLASRDCQDRALGSPP